jgi:hypothetical protein
VFASPAKILQSQFVRAVDGFFTSAGRNQNQAHRLFNSLLTGPRPFKLSNFQPELAFVRAPFETFLLYQALKGT